MERRDERRDERRERDDRRPGRGEPTERRRSPPRDRERRRSRSRDERRRSRSRERAPPRPPRERKTGFDLGPSGELTAPVPLASLPGVFPGLSGMGLPGLSAGSIGGAATTQQATRHARRIYIGGLPPTVEEAPLAVLFNQAMHSVRSVPQHACCLARADLLRLAAWWAPATAW